MKGIIKEFLLRGLVTCGFGPIVVAVIYMFLKLGGAADTLSVEEVAVGVFSLTALAFVAGGLTSVYKIERLPLMTAILIHGAALYVSYLLTYLVNGWLERGRTPILVFSVIFAVGYLVIWAVIYLITRRNTRMVNEMLLKKQRSESIK